MYTVVKLMIPSFHLNTVYIKAVFFLKLKRLLMCRYFFLSISKWYLNSKILRVRTYWFKNLLLIPTICEPPKSSKIKQLSHIWGLTVLFKKFDSEVSIYITRNHWTASSGDYIYVHSVVNFVMAIITMLWVNNLYLRTCKHKLFIFLVLWSVLYLLRTFLS